MTEERRQLKTVTKAPTFRYYKATHKPELNRRQKHTNQKLSLTKPKLIRLRNLPSIIALMIVFVAVVFNGLVDTAANYKYAAHSGVLPAESYYTKSINEILSRSPLYRTKITLSTRDLENRIIQKFPEISAATVSLPLVGTRPIIGIVFNKPVLAVQTNQKMLLLGEDGRVLAEAEGVTDLLPKLSDDSGLDYKPGQRLLLADEVRFILDLVKEVKSQGLTVQEIIIGTSPQDVIIKLSGDSYTVKLNFGFDVRQQLGALWATKLQIKNENKNPVEYIDVRLGERIFIK